LVVVSLAEEDCSLAVDVAGGLLATAPPPQADTVVATLRKSKLAH